MSIDFTDEETHPKMKFLTSEFSIQFNILFIFDFTLLLAQIVANTPATFGVFRTQVVHVRLLCNFFFRSFFRLRIKIRRAITWRRTNFIYSLQHTAMLSLPAEKYLWQIELASNTVNSIYGVIVFFKLP